MTLKRPLLAAMLVLALSGVMTADDADVLLSDSFESGGKAPDGWKQANTVPGVKYIYDRRQGSDGKRSLSLQKSINRYFPVAAWTRTVEHTGKKPAVSLTAKVKAEKAMKAILDVAFLDAQGEWMSHKWIAYIGAEEQGDPPATHDWKEYSGAADIPDGTKKILVGLQIYGPGKVWFDEVEARYVDSVEATNESKTSATSATEPSISPISVTLSNNIKGHYLLVPLGDDAAAPNEGYPVLLVLPGGDGSADFPSVCAEDW